MFPSQHIHSVLKQAIKQKRVCCVACAGLKVMFLLLQLHESPCMALFPVLFLLGIVEQQSSPRHHPPSPSTQMSAWGPQKHSSLLQLYHLQTNKCLVAQGRSSQKGGLVLLKACDYGDPTQVGDACQCIATLGKEAHVGRRKITASVFSMFLCF